MHCKECGIPLTQENRRNLGQYRANGSVRWNANCTACLAVMYRTRRDLEKLHPRPPPGSLCECCGRVAQLHLDHDHKTGDFRGFLCLNCNTGIGKFGDEIEGVAKALAYLVRARLAKDRAT